jgi:hypothetical protein
LESRSAQSLPNPRAGQEEEANLHFLLADYPNLLYYRREEASYYFRFVELPAFWGAAAAKYFALL